MRENIRVSANKIRDVGREIYFSTAHSLVTHCVLVESHCFPAVPKGLSYYHDSSSGAEVDFGIEN